MVVVGSLVVLLLRQVRLGEDVLQLGIGELVKDASLAAHSGAAGAQWRRLGAHGRQVT